MKPEVYIVKQGSAESKLLSRAGFDRKSLPIAEWKGSRRSQGGFGKAPFAWRIEGENDVRKFCENIASILGGKTPEKLTPSEKSALKRTRQTLAAFENRSKWQEKCTLAVRERKSTIEEYFSHRFPSASREDVELVASVTSEYTLDSLKELNEKADELLAGKVSGWKSAVQIFVEVSKM